MVDTREVTTRNRAAWNAIAEARRANCRSPEFFRNGGSTLDIEETVAMASVAGKRLLNLQCSAGNEALSWAVKGASVVGVDISDVAIEIAREQAAATGLDATFLAADVYDLPAPLQDASFDVVYSSAGVVCWLPDLAEWARIIMRALKPGGTFVLNEHHPIWECARVGSEGLRLEGSYFGGGVPNPPRGFDPERAVHAGAEPVEMAGVTFTWPLGHVVTALAMAGMRIRRVDERPIADLYLSSGKTPTAEERRLAGSLPAAYLIVATKD